VRATLVGAWPSLSRLYGIHPWDIHRLSIPELNAYLEDLEEYARASRG